MIPLLPQEEEEEARGDGSNSQEDETRTMIREEIPLSSVVNAAAPPPESSSSPPSSSSSSMPQLRLFDHDVVNDDSLATILEYCDFQSAVRFSRMTSHFLRERFGFGCGGNGSLLLHPRQKNNNDEHNKDSSSLSLTRTTSNTFDQVWKTIFLRSGFAHDNDEDTICKSGKKQEDSFWLRKCRQRLQLAAALQNPSSSSKSKSSRRCSIIPDRFFRFLPIFPEDYFSEEDVEVDIGLLFHLNNSDPPPVDFDCDSFLLTSTATSGEFLLLNPFSSTLSVYGSVLDNAVVSDAEAEVAAMVAQRKRRQSTSNTDHDVDDDMSLLNYYNQWTRPVQTLLTVDDLFETNLHDYFPAEQHHRRRGGSSSSSSSSTRRRTIVPHQVELAYIGIEAKPIFSFNDTTTTICGTMVAVGRVLTSSNENDIDDDDDLFLQHRQRQEDEEEVECTEIMAWFRMNHPSKGANVQHQESSSSSRLYGNRHVCRFRGALQCLDICPSRRLVYANPWQDRAVPPRQHQAERPAQRQQHAPNVIPRNNNNNMVREPTLLVGTPTISVHPLQEHHPTKCESNNDYYFPEPIYEWNCRQAVTVLRVDATGDFVVVATAKTQLQIWKMPPRQSSSSLPITHLQPTCVQTMDIQAAVQEAARKTKKQQQRQQDDAATGNPIGDDDDSVNHPVTNPTPVQDIFVARHLSMTSSGFVTLQHSVVHGNTLLLWKPTRRQDRRQECWQVQAMINLPLKAQRTPKVHYDGRRIIVFGQDHIGLIILVYRVLHSNEDLTAGAFDPSSSTVPARKSTASSSDTTSDHPPHSLFGVELSGGVINFDTNESSSASQPSTMSVQLQRRIRHIALDGMESYDSLYISCNERFILVNTKAGHHLLPDYNDTNRRLPSYQEGLLVIDLLDPPHSNLSNGLDCAWS